jgi:hypothetical protein
METAVIATSSSRKAGAPGTSYVRAWTVLLGLLSAVLMVGGCSAPLGATSGPAAPPSAVSTLGGAVYETRSFLVPLQITVPDWLPPVADQDRPNFVTWERPDQPAVRILVPVAVYSSGVAKATRPASDYLGYLLSLGARGARFTERTTMTIGDRPATLVTATTSRAMDGSLGCPEVVQSAADCFGLQPDLSLRIAVVPLPDKVLLVWLRTAVSSDPSEVAAKVASFEQMLASLRFSGAAPSTPTASAAPLEATPIDGVWSAHWSRSELAHSPLVNGEEINDENWGTYTLTFKRGKAVEKISNPKYAATNRFTYVVDGDVVTFVRGNERFVMRWLVNGESLQFTRDDALGVAPTPYVIRPYVRHL